METTTQTSNPATQNESQLTPPVIGDVVVGTVTKIIREIAFVEIGQEQEGYINLSEFRNQQGDVDLNLGDQIEAKVVSMRSGIRLSRGQIEDPQSLEEVRQAFLDQTPIEGTVVKVNKGGYELRIKQLRAFCPISQFALHYEKNPRRRVGETLSFLITEMNETDKGHNIVASRKSILEEEQNRRIQLMSTRFNVGDVIQGKVTQLTKFGAFVNVGDGIEGLIPMSELAHGRVEKASDVLSSKQDVEVKVIAVEPERNRLTLSLRQLVKDAWEVFVDEYTVGAQVSGKVTRLTDFGAFIELAPQVDGLLHVGSISASERVNHPSDRYEVGQDVDVVLEEIVRSDKPGQRRLRLMTLEVAEKRKPIDINLSEGEVVNVKVLEVKDKGLRVELSASLTGFIPLNETATPRGSKLSEHFTVDQELEVKLIQIDHKRNSLKLSIKAMETHAEEEAMKAIKKEAEGFASVGLGALKALLNK